MGETTVIAWTEKTWNPWQGCHKVSPGCLNCYMYAEKKRYGQDPATVVRSKPPTFNAPRKWTEPALVFTCSWSDFFIEEADAWRAEAWDVIRATPHLTYQILTKRPERIASCLPAGWGKGWPNVWLGTTVEDQAAADQRMPILAATPAAVRFVSCEPLLGPVNLRVVRADDSNTGMPQLGWVIVGGESGPHARPMAIRWAADLLAQCRAAGVAAFMKQTGPRPEPRRLPRPEYGPEAYTLETLAIRDRKGGDPAEWPEDLRIREFPCAPFSRPEDRR
jgi:protein gp37